MPGKAVPFRVYAQILIFSALIGLGALILLPFQRALYGGMTGIKDDLITRLENMLGRRVEYSSISPSFIGSFDVRNVRIIGHDNEPVLTMSRFRIAYSLFDLLRGRIQAIHSVRVDSPLINLNLQRDHDLIELFRNASAGKDGSQQDIASLFPEKLLVRIRNGRCVVANYRDIVELDALNVNFEIYDDRITVDGRWNIG
ncbi:MAG: hypothetical protein FWC24_07430, partial [Treponema sp.]|nr:hypothetical protein [Treponema sp.]